ncbi:unnamed protein product [Lactuca virosa]|uniref:Uncharacterized protein n=1 Tax=Lactuca virosa TaxID=75947 RepID=A0AAU9NL21_9ASTR|nr:unnamed protein product [Lactuca virosa]
MRPLELIPEFRPGRRRRVKKQEPTDAASPELEVLRHLCLRWVVELDVPDSLLDELGLTGNGSDDLLPEELNRIWSKLISKNFLVKKMIQIVADGERGQLLGGSVGVAGCLIVAAICRSAVVDCSQNGHGPGGSPILGAGDR